MAAGVACYHAAAMYIVFGLLAICAVALTTQSDWVYPIEIEPEHDSVSWSVELQGGQATCVAKSWIGRMGEQPLATLFAVELDETVAPNAHGETPLFALAPGTYDLHYEGDGCQWAFSLVPRAPA